MTTHADHDLPIADVRRVASPPAVRDPAREIGLPEPLRPDPLLPLPPGAVRPAGWLAVQLRRLLDGFVGHLPELSPWCRFEDSAWVDPRGRGAHGWEEMPYWLRGYVLLAFGLDDERAIEESRRRVEGILRTQRPDGWFGPEHNLTPARENAPGWETHGHTEQSRRAPDLWPNMIAADVLRFWHDATGDARVLELLERYFRWQLALPDEQFLPASWQQWRAGDNLISVHWLYARTRQPWLLELAERIHRHAARWDRDIPTWHGVNICQGFREPASWWVQSHDRSDLDATERVYRHVWTLYGQVPGGMFGADENCRPGYFGPRQAAETCSMVELLRSCAELLNLTGDAIWADRAEDVAFNSLPVAMTPDLRGLHYLTAPNMVQLDAADKRPLLENGGPMLAYAATRHRCCQHNASLGWPTFARNAWMASRDGGLAAVFYAPCSVEATVAGGTTVRIVEETDYPFGETIRLRVACREPVRFPLYLRVPSWCSRPEVKLNGRPLAAAGRKTQPAGGFWRPGACESAADWLRIERRFEPDDRIELTLPASLRAVRWRLNRDSVSLYLGPLAWSLKIAERWQPWDGVEDWPGWEVFPAGPWNYALAIDPDDLRGLELRRKPGELAEQPFEPDASPIELTVPARRVAGWRLEDNGLIGRVPASPVSDGGPVEAVTLVPMGCCRLRVSAFAVASRK